MGIRKIFLGVTLTALAASCSSNTGGTNKPNEPFEEEKREMHDHSIYSEGVDFATELWSKPEFIYSPENNIDGIKGMYLRSDYLGKESYAFCYLGYPENVKENNPAVLLLHGGGGTAYYEWVKKWTEQGYIALAIDLEGHVPLKTGTLVSFPQDLYTTSKYEAPHNVNLSDGHKPIEETWLYYACKTAIIGNSFLHNLEKVDRYNIGVTGVSWGGFITSIITGYDDRFAFSIPIYCTVGMENSGTPIGGYISSNPLFKVFDKMEPLSHVNTPLYLMVSNIDVYENISVASDVAGSMKNGSFAIIDKFPHSHFDAVNQPEPYLFAKTILNNEKVGKLTLEKDKVTVKNIDSNKILEASLYETSEATINSSIRWLGTDIDINEERSSITLDVNTTYSYVSIVSAEGLAISSNVLKI